MSFLDPNKVLDELELRKDMFAAEFGCGSGGFTIPLAQRLERGMVYALDIQQPPLSSLKGKALAGRIMNINIIRCDLESPDGSTLPEGKLDLALLPNVLFQVEDKNAIIKEAARVLKHGAEMLVIDWLENSPQGPSEGRVSPEEVKKISESLGLKLKKEFKAGDYHYGLIFVKL